MSEAPGEIQDELYSRVASFFGTEHFTKLRSSFVIVVGLGGVGSHAANMLARSGVSSLRLVDFDQVSLSSLNRHAAASMADVGTPKVMAMKQKILSVTPWVKVEAINEMFSAADAERLLSGNPDYVLDCIDDVATKAELIAHCTRCGIPVVTSMGAGGKADPTKIRIGTLRDCVKDPLASKMKWKLKKLHAVEAEQVDCVFSVEMPSVTLLPLDAEQQQAPDQFGAVDNFRIRVMPVLGTSPAIFGQSLASFVLCKLTGHPMDPESTEGSSKAFKHKLRQLLEANEMRRFGSRELVDLDDDDVEFVVRQVWGGRCALSQHRVGCHHPFTLARWDDRLPPTADNLVMLTQRELLMMERARGGEGRVNRRKINKENRAAKRAEAQAGDKMGKEEVQPSATDPALATAGRGEATDSSGSSEAVAEAAVAEFLPPGSYSYPTADVVARVEARLQWARAVCASKVEHDRRHPLTLEEQLLLQKWEGRANEGGVWTIGTGPHGTVAARWTFSMVLACSVCFGAGALVSRLLAGRK